MMNGIAKKQTKCILGPQSGVANDEKDYSENSLFCLPEDDEQLEQNMPW